MATIYSNPSTTVFREVNNTLEAPGQRAPLVVGGRNFTTITDVVTDVNLKPAPLGLVHRLRLRAVPCSASMSPACCTC